MSQTNTSTMMAQPNAEPTVLKAPLHVVHPETGAVLLSLELDARGPIVKIFDYTGKKKIELSACPEMGVMVSCLDGEDEDLWDVATLSVNPDGTGELGLRQKVTRYFSHAP